jgi:nitrite reductase/ring-hydroxylating ferredoxin subunit
VRPLRYFDRDLVAYRGKSGKLYVFDGHCAHLGAHLGYGGKVTGDDIICPFHNWRWDASGRNVDIPYSHRVNRTRRLAAWQVQERSGIVWVWYAEDDSVPTWQISQVPFLDSREEDGQYVRTTTRWDRLHVRPRTVAENAVDPAHFEFVHAQEPPAQAKDAQVDGPHFRTVLQLGQATLRYDLWGLGLVIARAEGLTAVCCTTPVDDSHSAIFLTVYAQPDADSDRCREEWERNITIWENMKPIEDGPILDSEQAYRLLRDWARGFRQEPAFQN